VTGEEAHWTFEQALDFVVHCDVARVREAPPFFSQNDWPGEVREAFWALWRAFEAGTVRAIEHFRAVDPLRWRNDRLAHLEPYEALKDNIGLGPFIKEAGRATRHTLIPVADLLAAFPAPTKPDSAKVKFNDLVSFYRGLKGSAKNREEADAAAQERFGSIPGRERVDARREAGFAGKGGRPKKPGR
jgi:hypothetical protein